MLSDYPHSKVLLLNASYEPMKIVSWQKAFVLWFLDKVDILEYSSSFINTTHQNFQKPSVLKLKSYVKRMPKKIRFTRENLFLRDDFTCQYCHKKESLKLLTVDHVVPASREGPRNWMNTVTSCRNCNQKKANRTPKEARMPLMKKPMEPAWLPTTKLELQKRNCPPDWRPYLQDLAEFC